MRDWYIIREKEEEKREGREIEIGSERERQRGERYYEMVYVRDELYQIKLEKRSGAISR